MTTLVPSTERPLPEFFFHEATRWCLIKKAFTYVSDWHSAEDLASGVIVRMLTLWRAGKLRGGPGMLSFAAKALRFEALNRHGRSVRSIVSIDANESILIDRSPLVGGDHSEQKLPNAISTVRQSQLDSVRRSCTETQLSRLTAFFSGEAITEIADREKVGKHAVTESIDSGLMNIQKRHMLPLNCGRRLSRAG